VEAILGALPKERQTVLISATMPPALLTIANKYMRSGWKQIDVSDPGSDDDGAPKVNQAVTHRAVATPAKFYVRAIAQALEDHMKGRDEYKIIVFLPGVKVVALAAALFKALGYDADEIHSDMSTGQRAKAAQRFATSKKAILFGTDAIARGVDFPNVSFVLQAGITDQETYVHRVGRTGRGGRSGEALLIASDFEERGLKDALKVHLPESSWSRWDDAKALKARSDSDVTTAARKVPAALFSRAYKGWVGAYASKARDLKIAKADVPALGAELFTQGMGMTSVPEISPELRKKMGLPAA
jgi:superfamily II DNA/RNA helicase